VDAALETLRDAKTIAVVGLDSRTDRVAYRIASYLQGAGYRIIPIHRGQFPAEEVLGERAYASLKDVPEHIDLVDVFVRSEQTGPVIDDAIAVGAKGVWLQAGIVNDEGLSRAAGRRPGRGTGPLHDGGTPGAVERRRDWSPSTGPTCWWHAANRGEPVRSTPLRRVGSGRRSRKRSAP